MSAEDNFLEALLKGSLLLTGIVLGLLFIGMVFISVLPIAFGYVIAGITWWLYDKVDERLHSQKRIKLNHIGYQTGSQLAAARRKQRQKELTEERERKRLEEQRVPETAPDSDWVEPEKEYELSGNLHLSSSLTNRQREKLYTLGYNVIKISPFGTSGAAIYWVKTRHNESKEHAFFCYILEAELRKYTDDIRMNATNGPDLVANWKGKRFCFDVETGKSLSRQPDWLESKFAYYQREYDRSFILVTKRGLKYKYSHYGDVMTRGKIKETLRQLFRRR